MRSAMAPEEEPRPQATSGLAAGVEVIAAAVRNLKPYEGFTPADIECLCCGTTSPDLLFPGHALMVVGELEIAPFAADLGADQHL